MDEDDYTINVNCIVSDYLQYRLGKDGHSWQVSPTKNCPNNKVTTTVRRVCGEFERRYTEQFSGAFCGQVELSYEGFRTVLENLIDSDMNWGRFIAILTFSGVMSVYAMNTKQSGHVDLIRDWTCSFIETRVQKWISNNNGWKGLVEFYNAPTEEKKNGVSGLLLGVGLGVFALGALLVNKA